MPMLAVVLWEFCGSCIVDFCASIAHCVVAVVLLTSKVCPSVWNCFDTLGGGVSSGVGSSHGSFSGVRLCSMVSRWVVILHCWFSSFNAVILVSGDESMGCSNFCSWVPIVVGGVF
jgi:hypothetical protein